MPITIYKRGAIWHYRGTVAGVGRLRGSTGTAVKETAQQVAAEIESRAWRSRLDGPASVLRFSDAAMLYRAARKSTRYLDKIEDYWKDTPIRQITGTAIRQSCDNLCPGVSGATWNRCVITPTQAIINHAAEAELCPPIRVKRFPVTKREKTPTSWDWVTTFQSACSPHLGALAKFMFLTGARVSEALRLEWTDVQLGNRRALIRQSKTASERWAHLPSDLVVALANIPGDRTGRVFGYACKSTAENHWKAAEKAAGLPHLPFHCCRHGFATGLLDKGVSPITVAKRGGWKSARHVFETYGHDIADRQVTDLLADTKTEQKKRKSL